MDASPVSELLRSKHLLSKKKPKSDVWNFFGFKTDPDDETKVLNRCEVVCALCEILLPYSGNTTNLRCHLITRHPGDYTEVQGTLSNAPSTPCSDVGAGPSKLRERKTLSSQSKTDVSIFILIPCVCVCVFRQALSDNSSKTWYIKCFRTGLWIPLLVFRAS